MTTGQKLLLCLIAGVTAGVINLVWAGRKTVREEYVAVNRDIKPGEIISPADLVPLELGTDPGVEPKSLLKFRDHQTLIGMRARRFMGKNSVVLVDDIKPEPAFPTPGPNEVVLPISLRGLDCPRSLMRVGRWVGFSVGPRIPDRDKITELELIGPFQVRSIGDKTREGDAADKYEPSVITVIGKTTRDATGRTVSDPKLSRLQAALGGSGSERVLRVVFMAAPQS